MDEIICPQCKNVLKGASVRLVQDACGHKKCRMCLLHDEEKCEQCVNKQKQCTASLESVIKYENNHTAVITCSNINRNKIDISSETEAIKNCDDRSKKISNILSVNSINLTSKSINKDKNVANTKNDETRKTEETPSLKRSYKTLIVPNHITVLKDPTLYKCNICNKTFSTKSHIKYHLYCNGVSGNKPFRCNECAKEFVLKSHLEVHMLIHAGLRPYSCSVCKKTFSLKSKLNRHKMLHSTIKPYICQECGKAFKTKESVRVHLLIHRGEKPFSCKYCFSKFSNSSNLNKHLATHSKEKVHMCDQCGKRFKLKWALTVHRRTHLLIRPYVCQTCSRAFINGKDLNRHQLVHLDAKAYSCGLCQTGFRRKDNLERHIRNSHPGEKVMPIKNPIKPLLTKLETHLPIDNPNAIKVITASPSSVLNKMSPSPAKCETRSVPIINAPLKLAFKTTAFKSNYNIHRDYVPPKIFSKQYDMTESVNICQRILSPHTPPPSRNVIQTQTKVNGKPLNYETSFEHKTHGVIKNIKFKLPPEYTNLTTKNTELLNDVKPLKPVTNVNLNVSELKDPNNTYHDLKNAPNVATATTSVIVNTNSNQQSEIHWRRRTLQNLNLQSKS